MSEKVEDAIEGSSPIGDEELDQVDIAYQKQQEFLAKAERLKVPLNQILEYFQDIVSRLLKKDSTIFNGDEDSLQRFVDKGLDKDLSYISEIIVDGIASQDHQIKLDRVERTMYYLQGIGLGEEFFDIDRIRRNKEQAEENFAMSYSNSLSAKEAEKEDRRP